LGASWSVLERLGGVMKRLEALLKAIWPDAENVEKPMVFFAFRALDALGSVLEASWSVFKRLKSILKRIKRLSAS
jgi:2-hydroxychromene-2-carboxylate isomerase